jgi:hypothetical protein
MKETFLWENFLPIGISHALDGKNFIAAAEAIKYPFYGV